MSEGLALGSFCQGGLCPDTHFDQEKTMILRQFVSPAKLFAMFHAGTRKSLLHLWQPLLQRHLFKFLDLLFESEVLGFNGGILIQHNSK